MAVEPGEWVGPVLGPDSAAELAAAMGRWSASQLRERAPQPFGLVNDELRLPAFVDAFVLDGSAGPSAPPIYRDFHGLQFSHSGLPVTAATESADSEVIRAKFARFPAGRSRE
jgi:hypothetical protein